MERRGWGSIITTLWPLSRGSTSPQTGGDRGNQLGQSYIQANSATQTDPALTTATLAAGKAQAQKVFYSNAGSTATIAAAPTITIIADGQTFSASVTYQAASQNAFGPIFGVKRINIGTSASSLTMGKYLDFYLLLDVSGSMGLPTAGQPNLPQLAPTIRMSIRAAAPSHVIPRKKCAQQSQNRANLPRV